ncbi:hypothetical protein D9613_010063 [Agrocybe pediades]|uniref:DUF5648 domain-containing protein n=1 Tax=Agrocybe pediades TaxID=84607 RepID=A0A8H4QY46_9AGAR|nr:hypothetical protein D9613_010063 [Agrocybe pediades]
MWTTTSQLALPTSRNRSARTDSLHGPRFPRLAHWYTISETEIEDAVDNQGFINEGIAGYVYPDETCGGAPLYSAYNPHVYAHLYSVSREEVKNATQRMGYEDTGMAAYILPPYLQKPPGSRAFRRDYYPPLGKSALSANILIGADNGYTLYLNGKQIGTGHNYPVAQAYCVRLAPSCNVFAVNVTNDLTVPNPAGLLAAIQIKYTDGFVETVVTDSTWHVNTNVPSGFQEVGFDDSAWPAATVEANYGASPWGQLSIPPSAASSRLSLTDANWIWTNEVNGGNAPIGNRPFRKTITLPAGQRATSATIYMAADNEYTLYIQGKFVGSGIDFRAAQKFVVDLLPYSQEVTIAVLARNDNGPTSPAGLIAEVDLTMEDCDCGSVVSLVTDGSWKYNLGTPVGFEQVGYDDSAWPTAIVEGKYGMQPWGNIAIPMAVAGPSGFITGAPSAPPAVLAT